MGCSRPPSRRHRPPRPRPPRRRPRRPRRRPTPTPTPKPSATPAPIPTPAPGKTIEGVDISHWQGTINWTSVAAAGKKFAFMKATEDTNYTDPTYTLQPIECQRRRTRRGRLPLRPAECDRRQRRGPGGPFHRRGVTGQRRSLSGPRPRAEQQPDLDPDDRLGQGVPRTRLPANRGPRRHLLLAELLEELHGRHRLVRLERLHHPVGRALDDRLVADACPRPTGAARAGRSGSTPRMAPCPGSPAASTSTATTAPTSRRSGSTSRSGGARGRPRHLLPRSASRPATRLRA